jgi:hypothetical protein
MLSTMEHLWKDTCSTTFSPFRRARGSDCQCWPRTSEQNEQTTLVFTVPTPATWHRGPGSFSPPRLEGFANYLRMSCSVIMSVQTMRNDEVHTNKYVCSMYLSTPCSRSEIAISHALHPIFRCTMVIRGTPALAYGTFTVNPGLLPQIPFSSRTSSFTPHSCCVRPSVPLVESSHAPRYPPRSNTSLGTSQWAGRRSWKLPKATTLPFQSTFPILFPYP